MPKITDKLLKKELKMSGNLNKKKNPFKGFSSEYLSMLVVLATLPPVTVQ
jgi:hypothetical protein